MIDKVRDSIFILLCVWIEFGEMLNIEASVRAMSMMFLLSGVLIVGAIGAVQNVNGNGRSKNIAYRSNVTVRRGNIPIANSSAIGGCRGKHVLGHLCCALRNVWGIDVTEALIAIVIDGGYRFVSLEEN